MKYKQIRRQGTIFGGELTSSDNLKASNFFKYIFQNRSHINFFQQNDATANNGNLWPRPFYVGLVLGRAYAINTSGRI
jgi:hypothetical protein